MMDRTGMYTADQHQIGIGGIAALRGGDVQIRTFGLGSCVALVVGDVRRRVRGMVHIALPNSSVDMRSAEKVPGRFADTGVPALVEAMRAAGSDSPLPTWRAAMIGGASVIGTGTIFNVGHRVREAVLAQVREVGFQIVLEDLGGSLSRTVSVSPATGTIAVISPTRENQKHEGVV